MSAVIELSLDDSGRIHIPAPVSDQLNLLPGMTLLVEDDEGGGLRLSVQPERQVLIEEDGILVADVEPLVDLTDIVRREREQRVLDLIERSGL